MIHKKFWLSTATIAFAIASGAAVTPSAATDPTGNPAPLSEVKVKKPPERAITASPGIQALADASTDIIIGDVLETAPRKAGEGARDTVKLKVVRTLFGLAAAGDTIGVYYHLLWADEKMQVLEAPKFEKGKRYIIFLRSGELTDPWLAVLSDNASLTKEVAAAVRVSHGDARGEWSSTDGSIAGFQFRLVAYRDEPSNGTPVISLHLDVRNTSGANNKTCFDLDGAKVAWEVSDAKGKAVAPTSSPGTGTQGSIRQLTLDSKESGRLRLTNSGGGVARDGVGHLELASDRVWGFARGGSGPYLLTGKVTIEPTKDRERWSGKVELPSVRIPLGD